MSNKQPAKTAEATAPAPAVPAPATAAPVPLQRPATGGCWVRNPDGTLSADPTVPKE